MINDGNQQKGDYLLKHSIILASQFHGIIGHFTIITTRHKIYYATLLISRPFLLMRLGYDRKRLFAEKVAA